MNKCIPYVIERSPSSWPKVIRNRRIWRGKYFTQLRKEEETRPNFLTDNQTDRERWRGDDQNNFRQSLMALWPRVQKFPKKLLADESYLARLA